MVDLPVDEAFAFDFLSILEIKYEYSGKQQLIDDIGRCRRRLADQMSVFDEVVKSDEYRKLKDANRETFRLVDLAKEDKVKASDVDYSNLVRCRARRELQEKFFGCGTSEIKFGYEKYGDK